jgi:hypothetical protein
MLALLVEHCAVVEPLDAYVASLLLKVWAVCDCLLLFLLILQ